MRLTLMNPEQRVPANHPIRLIKALAGVALKELSPLFEQMYSEVGRCDYCYCDTGRIDRLSLDDVRRPFVINSIVA
jgi:hypothetical protein